jgi:hypothetical protein
MIYRDLIPFVDYHTNILLIVLIILAFSSLTKAKIETPPVAELYQLILTWDDNSKSDIDLWAKDPTDNIVGFKRREGGDGSLFALKRDDTGQHSDRKTDGTYVLVNEEVISLRGTKDGEYIVNVHLFRHEPKETDLKAKVKLVQIKPYKELVEREVDLARTGDEKTLFRFKLDKDGNVSDINELQAKIAEVEDEGGSVVDFDEDGNMIVPAPNMGRPQLTIPPGLIPPSIIR